MKVSNEFKNSFWGTLTGSIMFAFLTYIFWNKEVWGTVFMVCCIIAMAACIGVMARNAIKDSREKKLRREAERRIELMDAIDKKISDATHPLFTGIAALSEKTNTLEKEIKEHQTVIVKLADFMTQYLEHSKSKS